MCIFSCTNGETFDPVIHLRTYYITKCKLLVCNATEIDIKILECGNLELKKKPHPTCNSIHISFHFPSLFNLLTDLQHQPFNS